MTANMEKKISQASFGMEDVNIEAMYVELVQEYEKAQKLEGNNIKIEAHDIDEPEDNDSDKKVIGKLLNMFKIKINFFN